ncbi:MAG: hypothetical protein QM804_11410 [Propionicimonas sp.]
MADRLTVDVPTPPGGWLPPWPNVAEIASVLPHQKWTLVGGLMAQLHSIRRGVAVLRPTLDVDMVLHIETVHGVVAEAARVLESLGYEFAPSIDDRSNTAHRFTRDDSTAGVVDLLIADHAAPRVIQSLRGRRMVAIEGGTQALKRTVNARLEIVPGRMTTVSVPLPFGATVLKAAAYLTDTRDRERHLRDAALLLAVIDDPYAERAGFAGSDRQRLLALANVLPDDAREWHGLPEPWRTDGQAALRILTA